MPRQRVSLDLHKNKILWILHNSIVEENDGLFEFYEITQQFDIPTRIIELSAEELDDEELCEVRHQEDWEEHPHTEQKVKAERDFITITQYGIRTVENWGDEFHDKIVRSIFDGAPSSNFQKYLANPRDFSEESAAVIPASDRFVEITHNQEYVETLRTLDDAILQFKEDHKFDNELGQEKSALVGALESGRKLLDDTKLWLPTATNILIEPLRRIDSIYKQAAVQGGVGAVVLLALQQILSLLGLA